LLALQVTNTPLTIIAFVGIISADRHRQEENGNHDRGFLRSTPNGHRGLSSADCHFRGLQRPVSGPF